MSDGIELRADRWAPSDGGSGLPVALLRTPYGRRGISGTALARPLAERGFQVIIQSTRGTFGSGGTFDPLRHERDDGLDTIEWVRAQPWYGGSIVLTGPSYLGYVQWAVADTGADVRAMIPQVTEAALTLEFLRADGFSLETPFTWGVMVAEQERRAAMIRQVLGSRRQRRALHSLPLGVSDVIAIGRRDAYIQDILVHDASSDRWAGIDHTARIRDVQVPVSSVAGWYDIFLPGQLRDFETLQALGRPVRLTVGPWTHTSPGVFSVAMKETLSFGLACARDEPPPERARVRLWMMGEEEWRDFPSWPPPGYEPKRYALSAGGMLAFDSTDVSGCNHYRYDPADPTPAVGGVRMIAGARRQSGRVDNRGLETRSDVLLYTTELLERDVEVVGNVYAEIWFRSSLQFADVFVRLCDVDERGRSTNVSDGLVSLHNAESLGCVRVELWPTAHRFRSGHRIRVQISSGSFPRFARNTGNGESYATARHLIPADQEVRFGPDCPSAIVLPTAAPVASR
jgi:putative CocE/NonD family hydrolase